MRTLALTAGAFVLLTMTIAYADGKLEPNWLNFPLFILLAFIVLRANMEVRK